MHDSSKSNPFDAETWALLPDYFEQLQRSPLNSELERPLLPVEMSRGCWWGEKKQCVFCGNNESMITYRSKSSNSIVDEINCLAKNPCILVKDCQARKRPLLCFFRACSTLLVKTDV